MTALAAPLAGFRDANDWAIENRQNPRYPLELPKLEVLDT